MKLEDLVLQNRLEHVAKAYQEKRSDVKKAILEASFSVDDVRMHLAEPMGMPYGRKLLFQNSTLEAIVMNWQKNSKCLPHDHGSSEGWVKILKGSASHVYYRKDNTLPVKYKKEIIREGNLFFAPKGIVHLMANETSEELITLHFYFPPIHNMEVFDLDASRSAVVRDDCGAWWPEVEEKLLEYRTLGSKVMGKESVE